MADEEKNTVDEVVESPDLRSLLGASEGFFLIRNNGDQVKIDWLKGKKIGLYFSASWCGPCRRFTPKLVELYKELSSKGDFEIVFVSADEDDEAFKGYFSKMPWLSVPFSNSEIRNKLDELFKVRGIPHLVLLDQDGRVSTEDGVQIIQEFGVEAYPFTPERINEVKEKEENARRNQTLKSILVSQARDFVVSSNGKKVPVTELEGKTVGLYFILSSFKSCADFTPKLLEVHKKLKEQSQGFEIVVISLDDEEDAFVKSFEGMPWLSLPFKDKSCEKLPRYFELSTLPTVVIIGPDGKTLNPNVAEAIEEHGSLAFPFTPEKFEELARLEIEREAAQTLESVLVTGDLDHVIDKNGTKIPVSNLVGKNILLYFSAHWCPPCRAFLPKLIDAYHKIKAKDAAFEVIFISSDKDQASFDEFFSGMPWLALPFGDARKASLSRKFKVYGIPMAIAIGPSGRTLTKEARDIISVHGADAYPFTEERLKEIENQCEEMAKGWPEKLKYPQHEHELVLTRRRSISYVCDGCEEGGNAWSYLCAECDFDLHPKCALAEQKESKDGGDLKEDEKPEEGTKEGWVCDGEVCTRA